MMYKSASETTLKTSSTPTGTDPNDYYSHLRISDMSYIKSQIRDAEDQALRWLEQGHDFILETWQLFQLDEEYNASMLQFALEALEKAHHATGHGDNDVEWAYRVLCSTRTEEAAAPVVSIFLRTLPSGTTPWKIPEEIHSRDLLPHYTSLAKKAVISQARGKLYDQWEEEHQAEKAAAAQRAKVEAFSAACAAKRREENEAALAAWRATPEQQQRQRELEQLRLPLEPEEATPKRTTPHQKWLAMTGETEPQREPTKTVWGAYQTLGHTPDPPPVPEQELEEHDPVLERLIAESKAIREAPLSAFAADAEDEEGALEQFEDAAAWERF